MNEFTSLLKRIGLNEYESKVYSSLNSGNLLTASDVSRKAGIPRARVYDVLMALEKKGFVMVSLGRPVSFKAVHPEKALINFEKQKRKAFESHLNEINSLKDLLKKNFSKTSNKEGFSEAWSISGNQINNIIDESLKNTQESVIISTSEDNALKKIQAFSSKFRSLKDKGVSLKFVLNSANSGRNSELNDFNVIQSKTNARFIVFDGKKILLFLNEKKEDNEKALLIESPFIAEYLSKLT